MIPANAPLPLVSVCIPTFNRGEWIAKAVDSALDQTYPNMQVVVSDNASTDHTQAVLSRYADDPRVVVLRNDENIGLVANYNAAAKASSGDYIVLLSDDDRLYPRHVELSLTRMFDATDPVDFTYGMALHVDRSGQPYHVRQVFGERHGAYSRRDEYAHTLRSCLICMPTACIPRRLLHEIGYLDERLIAADWMLALELAKLDVRVGYIAEPIVAVTVHGAQASGQRYMESGELLDERLTILEQALTLETFSRFHGTERALRDDLLLQRANIPPATDHVRKLLIESRIDALIDRLDVFMRAVPPLRSDRPTVSVILLSSGRGYALSRAIAMLDRQTYQAFEIIVVEDQQPTLAPFLRSLARSERMRVWRDPQETSRGQRIAAGIDLALAPIVVFLDDDDSFVPDYIERIVAELGDPLVEAVICGARAVSAHHVVQADGSAECRDLEYSEGIFRHNPRETAMIFDDVPLCAVALRRAALDRLPALGSHLGSRCFAPIHTDWTLFGDCELIGRVEERLRVSYLDEMYVEQRRTVTMLQSCGPLYEPTPTRAEIPHLVAAVARLYTEFPTTQPEELAARGLHQSVLGSAAAAFPQGYADGRAAMNLRAILAGRYTVREGALRVSEGFISELTPAEPKGSLRSTPETALTAAKDHS